MRNFDDIFNKLILMEIIVTSVFSILIFESILFVRKLSEINLFYSLTQNIDLDLDNDQTLTVTTQDINALEAFHFSEHSIEDQLDTSTFAELFSTGGSWESPELSVCTGSVHFSVLNKNLTSNFFLEFHEMRGKKSTSQNVKNMIIVWQNFMKMLFKAIV